MERSLVIVETTPNSLGNVEEFFRRVSLWGETPSSVRIIDGTVRAVYDISYDSDMKNEVQTMLVKALPSADIEVSVCDPTGRLNESLEGVTSLFAVLDDVHDHQDKLSVIDF